MANILQLNEELIQENNKFISDIILELKLIFENINQFFMNKELVIKKINNLIELGNNQINKNKSKYDSIKNEFNKISINKTQDYPDGRYVGEFKNGLREGKGIYYYKDGARYEGDYRNDQRNGRGIQYYNTGIIYMGEFLNNKKHGKGAMYYPNGNMTLGYYMNGNATGIHACLDSFGNIGPMNPNLF